eukprot:TRINITY_DN4274_c0_g1_i1.p1 TRINITY_DN4274_c0_g1~~TRINITY_DN4274_c0_g1_i1.p1  ORF type:complete len:512 (-),score=100.18 TRINITY_DN4274_c0_g1_i1:49-1584(-)
MSTFKGPKIGPVIASAPPAKQWPEVKMGKPAFTDIEVENQNHNEKKPTQPPIQLCDRCGYKNALTASFCISCGAKIQKKQDVLELQTKIIEGEKKFAALLQELEKLRAELTDSKNTLQKSTQKVQALMKQDLASSAQIVKLQEDLKTQRLQFDKEIASRDDVIRSLQQSMKQTKPPASGEDGDESLTIAVGQIKKLEQDKFELEQKLSQSQRVVLPEEPKRIGSRIANKPADSKSKAKRMPTGTIRQSMQDSGGAAFLKKSLSVVLAPGQPSTLDLFDMDQLLEVLKIDSFRRLFAVTLTNSVKTMASFELIEDNFDLLVYLFDYILTQIVLSESKKDTITIKLLMYSSYVLSKANTNIADQKVYVKDFIRLHDIWRDTIFWEECFWDEFSHSYKEEQKETKKDPNVNELFASLYSPFALNMIEWGVSEVEVQSFLIRAVKQYEIDPFKFPTLSADSCKFLKALTNDLNKKSTRRRENMRMTNYIATKRTKGEGAARKRGSILNSGLFAAQ